uniref:Putative secreted protein n=1 Tax=Rhipicephalus microplus TaxID=6941 RepID=A0A6G5A232_RHIMP
MMDLHMMYLLCCLSYICSHSFRGQPSAQTSANNELLYTCRIVHLATNRVTKKASAFKVLHHYTEPQAGILCFSRVHLVMARHGKYAKDNRMCPT